MLGFFCTAYIPLCLSFGAELTFPLEPALVNGTLTLTGSASAFLLSMLGAFMNHEGKDDDSLSDEELLRVRRLRTCTVIFILCGSSFIAFGLSFFIDEDLKRLRYSEQQREEQIRAGSYQSDEEGSSTHSDSSPAKKQA